MMNDVNSSTVLSLCDGLEVAPLDTNACEQEYVAILPNGRHYRLTSRLQQLMECIDGYHTLAEIAVALSQKWQHPVRPKQVWDMVQRYLVPNGILKGVASSEPPHRPESPFTWSIRLLSPRHTRLATQVGQYLFTWPAALLSLVVIIFAHLAVYTQPDRLGLGELVQALGNGDYLAVYGLTLLSTLIHEIGHASACRRFGEEYGDIGFAFRIIFPVFYADVTGIWKLSRWRRAAVDLGGVYFQLLIAALYYVLYRVTGSWLWLLAVLQIDILVLLAFNPFAKFDGYWIVSDVLGVPNLHHHLTQMVRRLASRSEVKPVALTRATRAWLWAYILAFWGVVVPLSVSSLVRAPEIVRRFVIAVDSSMQTIGSGWQVGDAAMIGVGLMRLISPVLTLVGVVLLLRRMVQNSMDKRLTVKRGT